MHGDDESLDKLQADVNSLRRELQEMKSAQLEQSAKQTKLEAELRAIRTMIEDRGQHRT